MWAPHSFMRRSLAINPTMAVTHIQLLAPNVSEAPRKAHMRRSLDNWGLVSTETGCAGKHRTSTPQHLRLNEKRDGLGTFFLGSGLGKLAKPAHQKALERSLAIALERSLGIKELSCPMLRVSHKSLWWRT